MAARGEIAWQALTASETLERTASDGACGLTDTEASRRLSAAGANELPARHRDGALLVFLRQLASTRPDLGANRWLLAGLLVSNLLQIAVVYLPALGGFFGTVPLGAREVVEVGVLGTLVLRVDEARKAFARRRGAR